MGHLQDFGKNLKDIDMKMIDTANQYLLENRWGGLTYEQCKNVWDTDKAEFKKRYPDLYEFLTNKDYQETAGKISSYAQTSIGEFIAETYAKMIKGETISDKAKKLYEKYKGPVLYE